MKDDPHRVCVIIPLDLARRGDQLLDRTLAIADCATALDFTVVIGLARRGLSQEEELQWALHGRDEVDIVKVETDSDIANLGRLRNRAVQASSSDTLLFLDADIAPDAEVFRAIVHALDEGSAWSMAPCLYLSERGTERYLSGKIDASALVEDALAFKARYVMHWAMPSSVLATTRKRFDSVGGFDENYGGHGYEDLDFMLRFALEHGVITPHAELAIDRTYRAPLLSSGFRAALAQSCLPLLLDGVVALHLHHERDKEDAFHQHRDTNRDRFRERFAYLSSVPGKPSPVPTLIEPFFAACAQRGIDHERYYALFDARPRHMLRKPQL